MRTLIKEIYACWRNVPTGQRLFGAEAEGTKEQSGVGMGGGQEIFCSWSPNLKVVHKSNLLSNWPFILYALSGSLMLTIQ